MVPEVRHAYPGGPQQVDSMPASQVHPHAHQGMSVLRRAAQAGNGWRAGWRGLGWQVKQHARAWRREEASMAFCGKCGGQLEGNERFCRNCGHDLSAAGASTSAPVAAAAPVAAPAAAQPVAPYPQFYPAPGQFPIVTMPQEVPKHHGWIWGAIIVVGILYGLYYIGTHDQQNQPQGQNPTQQPGTAPQPPGAQPGGPNASVVQQQLFTSQWRLTNGDVQLYNQIWKNRSNVAIQSSDLECDQDDQNGAVLSRQHVQLTDQGGAAVQPEQTVTFDPLDIGQAVQGMTKVNCGIVGVTAAQ
jgi:hypothetical protein